MEGWKWCRDGPHGLEADEAEGHSSPGFGFDGEDNRCEQSASQFGMSKLASNRHAARNATGDLQEVGLHVDDLELGAPFAGEEVPQAVGLGPDGAVDETVLVGAGVIPERIRVPE